MKDKKILYGIIISFIFLLSIGLTYAYFSVTTSVVGDRNDIKASAGTLSILYTDGPEISAKNIQPGWTETKTIKVENTGTLKAFYSIDWASLTNEITNDELVLSATCTSDIGTCSNIESMPVTDAELVLGVGINPGEEQTYVVTFEFTETSSAQNYNQDKKFNGVLNVYESTETFTVMGTLVDSGGNPINGATIEVHSTVRTDVTDASGKFNITGVEVGNHEMIFKNSSNTTIASDSVSLLSSTSEGVNGKQIIGDTSQGSVNTVIKLSSTSSIEEIKVLSSLKYKVLSNNTLYKDNVSSTYVSSASGIDFASKSVITNGQGLYSNNKLEDGKNKYFRGGSFCAYTNYATEATTGTNCTAAGGTWDNTNKKCSLNASRSACSTLGFTYYDLKNNVTFAGKKWKIIRIDENDNIRMILAEDTVIDKYYGNDYDDNANVGYMYAPDGGTSIEQTHQNLSTSIAKSWADSYYTSNLSSYSSYLADAGYCNDRSIATGLGYGTTAATYGPYARNYQNATASPRLNTSSWCPNASRDLFTTSSSSTGNKALTYPIAYITTDEARYGGVVVGVNNFVSYLKYNISYWTMSPWHNTGGFVYVSLIGSYGDASKEAPNYVPKKGIRPVISLKPTTVVASGTGTYDDPFIIQ